MIKITVCDDCETPLIFTFRWAFKEMYCLNCGALGDMFMGKKVRLTDELKLKKRIVDRIWKTLYGREGFLLPVASYTIDGCKKCKSGDNHGQHLTNREIRNNKIANKILKKMIGIIS